MVLYVFAFFSYNHDSFSSFLFSAPSVLGVCVCACVCVWIWGVERRNEKKNAVHLPSAIYIDWFLFFFNRGLDISPVGCMPWRDSLADQEGFKEKKRRYFHSGMRYSNEKRGLNCGIIHWWCLDKCEKQLYSWIPPKKVLHLTQRKSFSSSSPSCTLNLDVEQYSSPTSRLWVFTIVQSRSGSNMVLHTIHPSYVHSVDANCSLDHTSL